MKRINNKGLRLKRLLLSLSIMVGFGLLQPATGDAQAPGPQALVLNDLGPYAGIVAKMQGFDWNVTTVSMLELELLAGSVGGLSDYNVVWIPAQTDYPALHLLVQDGGPLGGFLQTGGVVVIMGLSPDEFWFDAAPRGVDAEPLPAGGAGVVTIAAPAHPMISGIGTGGQPLVAENLDPDATGGRGVILNVPGGSVAVVIATNTAGPVVVDYRHGTGHVFLSTLLREEDVCRANVILYIQSITR